MLSHRLGHCLEAQGLVHALLEGIWQRLSPVRVPLLLLLGRDVRGRLALRRRTSKLRNLWYAVQLWLALNDLLSASGSHREIGLTEETSGGEIAKKGENKNKSCL